MNVYRKSLVIQLLLFIVFFIMGANLIVGAYLGATMGWINYVLLGVLIAFAVFGFVLYKKEDPRIVVMTPKEMNLIKYLLYGYFFVYIVHMILPSILTTVDQKMLSLVVGIILMGIASYGVNMQLRLLKQK
ncbi:MAG: hypothetical protein CVV57_06480 [Tenericutes bacterium HGW-Tenericutes-2]|nr:MAG: hypothetical protein CVV57_06480 [Tenericutes bacterium HGW-Tenericutes-2]